MTTNAENPLMIEGAFFRLDMLNPSIKYVGGKNKLSCEVDEETFLAFKGADLKGVSITCKATVVRDGIEHPESKTKPLRTTQPTGEKPLSVQCAMMCKEPQFWAFLEQNNDNFVEIKSEEDAKRELIDAGYFIKSRSELDSVEEFAKSFIALRGVFRAWRNY